MDTRARHESQTDNYGRLAEAPGRTGAVKLLSIGEISRDTGVKVPTIRYYEQTGLLRVAERSDGNQRRFLPSDRERISFIKHARALGFSIEDVRDLLALSALPDSSCSSAHGIACRQLASAREKIRRLRMLARELSTILSDVHDGNQVKDCSLIKALADPGCAKRPQRNRTTRKTSSRV